LSFLIRGGLVLTGSGLIASDVVVRESQVEAVSTGIDVDVDREIDASGCLVGPGLVDIHAHLRDPGQTWKEDLSSGMRAAAAGGFTAIVVMPNTEPPVDSASVATDISTRASALGDVEVAVAGSLTVGRAGRIASDVESLYEAGVRLFTDDGDCLEDEQLAEELMSRISELPGALFCQHAERTALTEGGHMHDGGVSAKLAIGGMPSEAETAIVARDLELVRRTGVTYHCQHVSAAGTVDLIRSAKEDGLFVTAEVTPHHLSFTDSDVEELDPNFKMYPPLRSTADRAALRSGLLDGTIDVVATDHAPHTDEEKSAGFKAAPRGVIGLETAAPVVWDIVGDPHRFFEVLATNPAGLAGMIDQGRLIEPGSPANLVVFDPKATWTPETFFSKSANSPYLGAPMTGRVVATIARGHLVHDTRQVPA
jgi:dihydroorotase